MNIELLSKMIAELILDQDQVGLPGLGTFVAEVVPASFSDRGYTINPPYRRLTFFPGDCEDDSLVKLYASSNSEDIDYDKAGAIIRHFLEQVRQVLMDRKTVVFPGLGRLRATRENNFFFIADEDLDIYPDGYALPPVSMKTRSVQPEEISAEISALASIVAAPSSREKEEAPSVEEKSAEPALHSEAKRKTSGGEEEKRKTAGSEKENRETAGAKPGRSRWWVVPLVLLAAAAVFFATFMILAQSAPDFIDSILYTPEELDIINY